MILLLSEERDISTDNVVEWLRHYNAPFLRINTSDINLVQNIRMDSTGASIQLYDSCVNLSNVKAVWFRRGSFRFVSDYFRYSDKSDEVNHQVARQLNNDAQVLSNYLYYALSKNAYTINHPAQYNLNKLVVLDLARQSGLKTPDTLITRSKEDVQTYQKHAQKKLITKQLSDNFRIQEDKISYGVGTRIVSSVPNFFFYSLFQTRIERLCELRVFYLNNQFFPAAIFVDDHLPDSRSLRLGGNRARIVPFMLPDEVLHALSELTAKVNVNCGSIDMILDKEGNYFFLEINPVGQYDYIEIACNYPISKLIADSLCGR